MISMGVDAIPRGVPSDYCSQGGDFAPEGAEAAGCAVRGEGGCSSASWVGLVRFRISVYWVRRLGRVMRLGRSWLCWLS